RRGAQPDPPVRDAAPVGEYLAGTTSRVLNRLARLRRSFSSGRVPIDVLDDAVQELAALSGLWAESTGRGPGWRFGEIGRRLERADVVLGLIGALAQPPVDDPAGDGGVPGDGG